MLQDLFGKVKKRAAVEGKKKTSDMDVPQNLLFQCPKCRAVMLMDEFEENGKVCRKCGHHARLTAWERVRLTATPAPSGSCLKSCLRRTRSPSPATGPRWRPPSARPA